MFGVKVTHSRGHWNTLERVSIRHPDTLTPHGFFLRTPKDESSPPTVSVRKSWVKGNASRPTSELAHGSRRALLVRHCCESVYCSGLVRGLHDVCRQVLSVLLWILGKYGTRHRKAFLKHLKINQIQNCVPRKEILSLKNQLMFSRLDNLHSFGWNEGPHGQEEFAKFLQHIQIYEISAVMYFTAWCAAYSRVDFLNELLPVRNPQLSALIG